MEKEPIYYSGRFWVTLYFIIYCFYIFLQFSLGILGNSEIEINYLILRFINKEASLPIEIFSWGWTGFVSMYCCFDRIVNIRETCALTSGQMSFGDLAKLRKIIVMTLLLLLIATLFSFITDMNYQLDSLATAFVTSTTIYVSGNKLIKSFKYKGPDKNGDGVPDQVEDFYYSWKRQQIKDGVEERFLTFEYFLDEHPDLRRRITK